MSDISKRNISKREFITFMASGKNPKLINENSSPAINFIHPLTYSPKSDKNKTVLLIPMNYKFLRKFYERYRKMKK